MRDSSSSFEPQEPRRLDPVPAESSRRAGNDPWIWTDEAIERTFTDFMRGRTQWPSMADFKAAGLFPMYRAVVKRKALDHWRMHFGFEPGRPRRYSEREIRAAFQPVVEQLGHWPSLDESIAAGVEDVHRYLSVRDQHDMWAARFDVERHKRAPLTEEQAVAQARESIRELGKLPGEVGLRRRGYGQLAVRVKDNGGARGFRARYRL